MRQVGVPLGLICLAFAGWAVARGNISQGVFAVILGLVALSSWYVTTRSVRYQRWKHSSDAVGLEMAAPIAVVGALATGWGIWVLASGPTTRGLVAGVGLVLGGLCFLGLCLYGIWWWRSVRSVFAKRR